MYCEQVNEIIIRVLVIGLNGVELIINWNYEHDSADLFNMKSYYQLIMPITKCEKLSKATVEKRLSKSRENISE